MSVKLIGLGCAGYWSDGWNRLDGIIVSLSIVEIVLTALFAGAGMKLAFLRILRMLRVARMLRLMKSWKGLYKIVTTFGKVREGRQRHATDAAPRDPAPHDDHVASHRSHGARATVSARRPFRR